MNGKQSNCVWTSDYRKKKKKLSFTYMWKEDRLKNEQVRANGVTCWWEITNWPICRAYLEIFSTLRVNRETQNYI